MEHLRNERDKIFVCNYKELQITVQVVSRERLSVAYILFSKYCLLFIKVIQILDTVLGHFFLDHSAPRA